MRSQLIQSAVVRELQVLAESAKRISPSLQHNHPEVSWREVIGLRNVLVHDYLEIDLEEIWEIIEFDLPVLKDQIQKIVQGLK